jgi:hypothetical protein
LRAAIWRDMKFEIDCVLMRLARPILKLSSSPERINP